MFLKCIVHHNQFSKLVNYLKHNAMSSQCFSWKVLDANDTF